VTTDRELLLELLEHNKQSITPSRGKQNAAIIRKVCDHLGVDEDDFLPRHIRNNKKDWGL
jgi:hypothetical protein